jgi:hypothetical protein
MSEALKKSSSADELANKLEISPVSIPAAYFNNSSIPYIGRDLIISGTIFGLPVGGKSDIIKGERALALVYLNNENQYEATDVEDLKVQITDQVKQEMQQKSRKILIENGEVIDLRYRFYN